MYEASCCGVSGGEVNPDLRDCEGKAGVVQRHIPVQNKSAVIFEGKSQHFVFTVILMSVIEEAA
jgi:hypothetical protein